MTVDISQFYQVFFDESLEHLANMESSLLRLEAAEDDPELINVIFRGAHSIKGGSGTFGFHAISEFTHLLETLLEQIRSGKRVISSDITTILLESVDVLRDMINSLKSGSEPEGQSGASLRQRLSAILKGSDNLKGDEPPTVGETATVGSSSELGWRIKFKPYRHIFKTGNDPYRIMRELSTMGHVEVKADVAALPSLKEMDPEECYLSWEVLLHGKTLRSEIEEVFAWVEGDCDLDISAFEAKDGVPHEESAIEKRGTVENSDVNTVERRTGHERRHPESESIRVSIEKIDAIINMVGELVITQSMLSQLGTSMHEQNGAALESLRDGLVQLERNTRELQEGVMRIRMLPISFAFSRFPRLVHDLSQKLGKKVELKLSGEQTELDKTVMEKISDPLVHLVRNAIDHGIETPDERIKSGKCDTGQIHLEAYHQGGNIIIEISDDGAGLNIERIVKKARDRGLLPEDGEYDDQRIMDLVFEPGFSTAEAVSDVSGRGVGMDVVRRNIRDLGGNVDVSSEPGHGSRFTIRLPLTLAILDGQLVKVSDQVYITPLVSIVESLQVRTECVNTIAGRGKVYHLRDEYIPIMDLYKAFGITENRTGLSERLLVVVEGEGKKVGLVVDDLMGQQQVVIKSLESNYKPVAGISGATILGEGTVALILDVAQLVKTACSNVNQLDIGSDKTAAVA